MLSPIIEKSMVTGIELGWISSSFTEHFRMATARIGRCEIVVGSWGIFHLCMLLIFALLLFSIYFYMCNFDHSILCTMVLFTGLYPSHLWYSLGVSLCQRLLGCAYYFDGLWLPHPPSGWAMLSAR